MRRLGAWTLAALILILEPASARTGFGEPLEATDPEFQAPILPAGTARSAGTEAYHYAHDPDGSLGASGTGPRSGDERYILRLSFEFGPDPAPRPSDFLLGEGAWVGASLVANLTPLPDASAPQILLTATTPTHWYLDIDRDGRVSVGDLRLSGPADSTGSRVAGGAPDLAYPTSSRFVPQRLPLRALAWLDADGDADLGPGDGLFVDDDLDYDGFDEALSSGDLRLAPRPGLVTVGQDGIRPGFARWDLRDPVGSGRPARLLLQDPDGSLTAGAPPAATGDEQLFLRLDAADPSDRPAPGDLAVHLGTWFTASAAGPAFAWNATEDPPWGLPPRLLLLGPQGLADAYWDLAGDGRVSPHDIRITEGPDGPAYSRVAPTSRDVGRAADEGSTWTWSDPGVLGHDGDGNGRPGPGDPLLLSLSEDREEAPRPGDVRLTAGFGPAGSRLRPDSTETRPEFRALGASLRVLLHVPDPARPDDERLFLRFHNGTHTILRNDDLDLSSGDFVADGPDRDKAIIDVTSRARLKRATLQGQNALYLSLQSDASLDVGDLRLTNLTLGGSRLLAGERVDEDHADYRAAPDPVLVDRPAAWHILHWDLDADGRIGPGDRALWDLVPGGGLGSGRLEPGDLRLLSATAERAQPRAQAPDPNPRGPVDGSGGASPSSKVPPLWALTTLVLASILLGVVATLFLLRRRPAQAPPPGPRRPPGAASPQAPRPARPPPRQISPKPPGKRR